MDPLRDGKERWEVAHIIAQSPLLQVCARNVYPGTLRSQSLLITFSWAGMFEALQQETAHLGIRSLLVEPGLFRTQVFSPTNVCQNLCPIPDYASATKMMDEFLAATAGNEPGDPRKAVKVIIDVVKNEGVGKGREFPARLPLGRDALQIIRKKCSDTLALLDSWEDVVVSTDITV